MPSPPAGFLKSYDPVDPRNLNRKEMLYTSTPAGAFAGQHLTSFAIDEPTDRPLGSVIWPLTVGVPFASGTRSTVADLAITDASQRAIPAQFAKALDWRFGSGYSWVHCDFTAPFGASEESTRRLSTGVANPAPSPALSVIDGATTITVDTGAIRFVVSKTAFSLFSSLTTPTASLIGSSKLYWKDTVGQEYLSSGVVDSISIVKNGPIKAMIRVEGKFVGPRTLLRYQVWITAWAGLPWVRIQHRLLLDQNLTVRFTFTPPSTIVQTEVGSTTNLGSTLSTGWQTGDPVTFSHSHETQQFSDFDVYNDPAGATGMPTVSGAALRRDTTYFVRAVTATTQSIHRTQVDANSGANPINFTGAATINGNPAHNYLTVRAPWLNEYGMRFNLDFVPTEATIGLANGSETSYQIASVQSVLASQASHNTALISLGAGAPSSAQTLGGYAAARNVATGLCAAVKDFGNVGPKQFFIDNGQLTVKLWGGQLMDMREEAHTRYLSANGHTNYVSGGKEWLTDVGEANSFGIAKTHEVWLWPDGQSNILANDLVQRPACCVASPTFNCQSEYLWGVRPASATDPRFADVEKSFENLYRYRTTRDVAAMDYDEYRFGNLHLFDSGDFRECDNNGEDSGEAFWMQLYRTGARYWLEEGIRNIRNFTDISTVNVGQTTNASNFHKKLGVGMNFAQIPWAWQQAYGDTFEDFPQCLLLCWLMTGDEPAKECLEIRAAERRASGYGDASLPPGGLAAVTRTQYGALWPKCTYYEYTGESQWLTSATNWAQQFVDAQNAAFATLNAGKLFPNNIFHGYFWSGLRYLYRATGLAKWATALEQYVLDFVTTPVTHFASPDWRTIVMDASQLQTDNAIATASRLSGELAYRHTGDSDYLQEPLHRLLGEARVIHPEGSVVRGYSDMQGIDMPNMVRTGVYLLGAAADAGWPLDNWKGNYPLFQSITIASSPWVSELVIYVNKTINVTATLKLLFKNTNLSGIETPATMCAVITNPNATVTTPAITFGAQASISFPSGQPLGIYKIQIQGQQQLFWACPKTDMAGCVVDAGASSELRITRELGPADVFFNMLPSTLTLAMAVPANTWEFYILPVSIRDRNYVELGRFDYSGQSDLAYHAATIGTGGITGPLVACMGQRPYSATQLYSLPVVQMGGADRWFSVVANQWFKPL